MRESDTIPIKYKKQLIFDNEIKISFLLSVMRRHYQQREESSQLRRFRVECLNYGSSFNKDDEKHGNIKIVGAPANPLATCTYI